MDEQPTWWSLMPAVRQFDAVMALDNEGMRRLERGLQSMYDRVSIDNKLFLIDVAHCVTQLRLERYLGIAATKELKHRHHGN